MASAPVERSGPDSEYRTLQGAKNGPSDLADCKAHMEARAGEQGEGIEGSKTPVLGA